MVSGKHKSRTFRRVKLTTPGGRNIIHYEKRKPKAAHCSRCGKELKGMPRERPHIMRNLAKTKKRPQRPYGGNLCSSCSRRIFIQKARA